IKMFVMTALFTVLFFGNAIATEYLALNALIVVAISAVLTVISMTLAHAICARLKIEHLFKFYWTVVTALAAISLVLVWCL
ncbi:MAG: NADH-quinone oxidoreductase subunit H, partial [Oscillospiraceae bacterium]|nr:NADH-quinone oxidoreductase subunit H [Oscillospiraceae bacterium]